MIKKIVEIYVPLMDGSEYEAYLGNHEDAIKEFIDLSGNIEVCFNKKPISSLKIKKLGRRSKEIKEIFKDKFLGSAISKFLKFSSEISILSKEDYKKKEEYFYSFNYFVKDYVIHLIIYSNLAKPGAFDTREGLMKTTEILEGTKIKIEEFHMLANSITNAVWLAQKYMWPPIKELPIKFSLDWLNNHWLSFENISENKIQRALNAFSYIFHNNLSSENDSPSDLFYALIGIEAIFVSGDNNIQGQVDQKTQLLLGPRKEYKKVFTELYAYRSRFIHGQLNFINKYYSGEEDITINQLLKTYEHSSYAIAILISAIQKHIEMDKNEFEYELILKN